MRRFEPNTLNKFNDYTYSADVEYAIKNKLYPIKNQTRYKSRFLWEKMHFY